jgi:nitroreductase
MRLSSREVPVPVGADAPVFEVLSTVRAMRRLKPDPVPSELLERLVEVASWAPTASNGQGYRFVIVTDRDQVAKLAELWKVVIDWYLATIGSSPPPAMSAAAHARMVAAIRYQRDHFSATPAIIVPCYDTRGIREAVRRAGARAVLRATLALGPRRLLGLLGNPRLRGDDANAASIYPAVQNLLIGARAHGLAATLTSVHLLLEREFKQVLGIPRWVRTYALIPVGWPVGRMGPVRRPPAATLIHRDRWGAGQ